MQKNKATFYQRFLKTPCLIFLILMTWILAVYHRGVLSPDYLVRDQPKVEVDKIGSFIPKEKFGINQLILQGTPYQRGFAAGQLTKELMFQEETSLTQRLNQFFPSPLIRRVFEVAGIRLFWGIDSYFERPFVEEMYGVSQSASHDFDYLMDPFTRQLVYHGLHEVGQMFVDAGKEDGFGCTVFAVPFQNSWIIGRNFDFEGGRIFDEDKILKWVFPDQGNAFVSVTWAGMVGAVTGVNEKGVYGSINAAGSSQYRRMGTPSTLVLLKALQFSSSAEEAAKLIEKETMFITDIFVLADAHEVYRVEKSPAKTSIVKLTAASVVTNHLQSVDFEKDSVNQKRKEQQTTVQRFERGEVLLGQLARTISADSSGSELESQVLGFLRDKGEMDGKKLPLGNRMAIDALIATHAVVFNAQEQVLYVSQGPALSGPFVGFDLKSSFASKTPTLKKILPPDPDISQKRFFEVKDSLEKVSLAQRKIKQGECAKAGVLLKGAAANQLEHSSYYTALGNWHECNKESLEAQVAWRKAMDLKPAYLQERQYLLGKLAK